LKAEQPNLKNTEIIKVMAVEWNMLTDEQKIPYLEQTESQKQRYEAEMLAYKDMKAKAEATEKAKKPAKAEPK